MLPGLTSYRGDGSDCGPNIDPVPNGSGSIRKLDTVITTFNLPGLEPDLALPVVRPSLPHAANSIAATDMSNVEKAGWLQG
ncbi:hypothetical protein Vi05172_g5166 [Venturia inaequalis]|nr:hypothetical protein Vi05172_g5166 [Venturia inaequalis]